MAIIGVGGNSMPPAASFASEIEVQYLIPADWQTGESEFNTSGAETSPSSANAICDPAVVQAAYAQERRNSGGGAARQPVRVGYDRGFVISSQEPADLGTGDSPFLLRLNGWGQLRGTNFNSDGSNPDLNQFQLKRARLVFSGHAFTPDFAYFVQVDGRSSSGDDIRLLDYFLTYDLGHHALDLDDNALHLKAGLYKVPFTLARYLSGREFEFADRSMASMFFDVNRSLACGLYGEHTDVLLPWNWEVAIFNGLVTGGAETGSSGQLDNNFAYSGRLSFYPTGEWGPGQLADFQYHETLAMRSGMAFANSTVERFGAAEFQSARVVDSGSQLVSLLPLAVDKYTVDLYAVDSSFKWRGWSMTLEYYFRHIREFESPLVGSLFDHGFWFQLGKFVVPGKLEFLTRWSRVVGDSGTLGLANQSSDEVAGGAVWYFRQQNAKLTFDATHLDGAPISSAALDISPGAVGWLFRTQLQFAF